MRNLTMMTDLYQLTMMYGYYKCGMRDNVATFDMFYRSKDESTHYASFGRRLRQQRNGPRCA